MEEQECEVLHEETVQNVKKQMLDELENSKSECVYFDGYNYLAPHLIPL